MSEHPVNTRKASMQLVLEVYDWHTQLFKNALDGISDEAARQRLNTKANHIGWLAGSLVQGRFLLGSHLGLDQKQTSDELFKDFQGIKDDVTYPPLEEYRKDWDRISPALRDKLSQLSEEELGGPDPFEMPGLKIVLLQSITYMTDRESYVIGQLGLWRRLLDYPAMKFG